MFLSNFAVRRPIAMSCVIIGLTLLGINSYRKLGLELMPKVDFPIVTIVTVYPGASPSEIETDVAKRIEDAVTSIAGLKTVTSSCMENVCLSSLEFDLDVDVDIAAMDVREKLDLIRADLPAAVEDPKIQKFDVNASPIITMAFTGDAPLEELYDYADNQLRDRLSTIPGVAEVQLVGGAKREVHVLLDREKLAARGLTTSDVARAIQLGTGTIPSGRVRDHGTEYAVKYDADVAHERELGELEIGNQRGQRCRIKDVGHVEMTTAELRQRARCDGRPAVAIKIVKKADANAVSVTKRVRAELGKVNRTLPGGMELVWITDTGRFIEATNVSAWINVLEGILLTAAILFLFLYNFRALLVVSITMPLTIVIGLYCMDLVDFTLNIPTLIAIGMSVGVLVTNSIVVLEAIVKRLDQSGDAKQASMLGAKEAFIAVLASAGTNAVVLFPLAMMHSKIGLIFRPLALTMLIMTVVSLFVSFSLTPMLCSLLLKPVGENRRGILATLEKGWNWLFNLVIRGYRACLMFLNRRRWAAALVLIGVIVLFVHSLRVAKELGMGFVTEPDKGEVYIKLEYPTHYDLKRTTQRVATVEKRLEGLPELKHKLSMLGKVQGIIGKSSEGVYLAQIILKFSERTERRETITDLLAAVRARVADIPGCVVTVQQPSVMGGQESPVVLEFSGEDLDTLDAIALEMQQKTLQIPGLLEPDTTVREGKPEIRIRPQRDVLGDLHLPSQAVAVSMRGNLEGLDSGIFKRNARNYDIVVKLEEQEGRAQIADMAFRGAAGRQLVLENLSTIEQGRAPVQITRKNKRRVSILYANLAVGEPIGVAVSKMTTVIDKLNLPPGYSHYFAGQYEIMAEGNAGFAEAMLIAIVLVFLTLAAIMESWSQTFLILITLPLALIGTFWALFLAHENIGMFVIMGIIIMIGIVVNNAILIMDQLNVHIAEGVPRHQAMISAACERFRPIIMITLAAVLGMLPLAFGRGIGAEMRNSVGIASAGGILVSGILTLLVLPIVYDLITPSGKRDRKRDKPSEEQAASEF